MGALQRPFLQFLFTGLPELPVKGKLLEGEETGFPSSVAVGIEPELLTQDSHALMAVKERHSALLHLDSTHEQPQANCVSSSVPQFPPRSNRDS